MKFFDFGMQEKVDNKFAQVYTRRQHRHNDHFNPDLPLYDPNPPEVELCDLQEAENDQRNASAFHVEGHRDIGMDDLSIASFKCFISSPSSFVISKSLEAQSDP